MGCSRRFIINMFDASFFQCFMKTFYPGIHPFRFNCANAQVHNFYFLIKGGSVCPGPIIHLFYVAALLKKTCATKSADVSKLVKIRHRGLKSLETRSEGVV